MPPSAAGHGLPFSLKKSNVQFVSNNYSVAFRCGLLVATRVPQVVAKTEVGWIRIL